MTTRHDSTTYRPNSTVNRFNSTTARHDSTTDRPNSTSDIPDSTPYTCKSDSYSINSTIDTCNSDTYSPISTTNRIKKEAHAAATHICNFAHALTQAKKLQKSVAAPPQKDPPAKTFSNLALRMTHSKKTILILPDFVDNDEKFIILLLLTRA